MVYNFKGVTFMNIGIFTDQYYPQLSGVVISIKNLYETLEKMGHTCYIFSCNVIKGSEDNIELKNKRIINLPGRKYPFKVANCYKYNFFHGKFVKIIKKYNLDIIHLNTEFDISKTARKAAKKLHIPIVYTMHTAWIEYICTLFPRADKIKLVHKFLAMIMRRKFTKPSSKCAEITILPTKKMIPNLKSYGIKEDKIEIIPTGLDLSRFDSEKIDNNKLEQLKEKFNIKNKVVYTFIGRIAKEKNIPALIRSYADVFKDNDDTRLLIVGDGPELNNIKKLASDLKIADKCIFPGMIDWSEIPYYYHLGSFFVNASTSETQGLTYIEAIASSLPVVVQNDVCIDGVIEDNYNGFIFNGEEELKEKLKYTYSIRHNLEAYKINCLTSSKKFTKEIFAEKVFNVYLKAIESYNQRHNKKK